MRRKPKILVIDDEYEICEFTKAMLEKTNKFDAITTANAAEGIALAKTQHPDLILLDVAMPDMDGPQVAEAIRQDPRTKDIPIVFLTGLTNKKELDNNNGIIGGNFFIAKPTDNKELVARIESILQEAKQQ